MTVHELYLPINGEPWKVPPISVGRKNGKYFPRFGQDAQLQSYKNAIAEALAGVEPLPEGQYDLQFYFWRRLDDYQGKKGRVRKHVVDATNLQKATEDALQGVLFKNDRDVRVVSSAVVEQGPEVVNPGVGIVARLREVGETVLIPKVIYLARQADINSAVERNSSNDWNPGEEASDIF